MRLTNTTRSARRPCPRASPGLTTSMPFCRSRSTAGSPVGRIIDMVSPFSGVPLCGCLDRHGRRQRLIEIEQDVVDVLDADRQTHVAVGDAGREPVFGRQLRVRRGRRMDGERAGIADIGDVIEELQRVDEAAAGLLPSGNLEADQAAETAVQIGTRYAAAARPRIGRDRSPARPPDARPNSRRPPRALRQCSRMRSGKVSSPWMNWKALKGLTA